MDTNGSATATRWNGCQLNSLSCKNAVEWFSAER